MNEPSSESRPISRFEESAALRRRLLVALVVPLVLMLALAVVLVLQVRNLLAATNWVDHTDEVIGAANRLELVCVDMETGVRGYLLSNERRFLEPYDRGRAQFADMFARLSRSVADEAQREQLRAVATSVDAWLRVAEAVIARRTRTDWQVDIEMQGHAKDLFDRLRRDFDAFLASEIELRDARTAAACAAARSVTGVALAAALLLGALLALTGARQLGGVVRGYSALLVAARNRAAALVAAEAALRDLNADLEEQVRRRTAELTAANRELESFCYSVSHDLRSPLRGINGFAQVLLEDEGDKLDGRARAHLERIRAAARRMGQLIDDLLMLSRVTRAPLAKERVDLGALATKILARLRAAEPARRVEVVIASPLPAEGDARLLEVAMENLVGNAWKYTRGVAAARIEIDRDVASRPVVYRVRDTGVGFDMAYASKLFEPFQRLHTEAQFEGTGIGLATVQRVIQRHGGRVWAEAKPGLGATIFFTLEPGNQGC